MEYRCKYCKDTHFLTSKVLPDGTEFKSFCYCHPLVRRGVVKPLEGDSAIDRLRDKGRIGRAKEYVD